MHRSALLSLALVALAQGAVLIGCARSEAVAQEEKIWSDGALRAHLRELTEPIVPGDSARAARRTLYAARQMEAAGLMPARDPSFLLTMGAPRSPVVGPLAPDPARAHVLGYVVGRHPSHYDELVLVAADLDSPGAAAVLAGARALAVRALDTQVPERTVLFALWAPPRTGDVGLRDFLANPTWGLDSIARVVLVTTDTSAVSESRRLLEARGISSDVVAVTDQSVTGPNAALEVEEARLFARAALLTEVLFARLLSVATVADSTAAGVAQTVR